MDDVVIRRALAADAQAIGALWEKLVAYHHALDDRLPVGAADGGATYARYVQDRLEHSHSHTCILVAEDDGHIVGFVLGVIMDMVPDMFVQSAGGYLSDIFIEDGYRRNGVGAKLVETLVSWFRSRGVDYFEWYVAAQNHEAQAFWRSMGGREIMVRMRMEL